MNNEEKLIAMKGFSSQMQKEAEPWEEKHIRSAGKLAPYYKGIISEHGGIRLPEGRLSDAAIKKYFNDPKYKSVKEKDGSRIIYIADQLKTASLGFEMAQIASSKSNPVGYLKK